MAKQKIAKSGSGCKNTAVNNESGISEDELNGTQEQSRKMEQRQNLEDGTSENLQKDGGMEDE